MLQALRAALPGYAHAVTLEAMEHAVNEIEYWIALGPLAELAQALQITLEEKDQ